MIIIKAIVSVPHYPFTRGRDDERKVVLSGRQIADLAPITDNRLLAF